MNTEFTPQTSVSLFEQRYVKRLDLEGCAKREAEYLRGYDLSAIRAYASNGEYISAMKKECAKQYTKASEKAYVIHKAESQGDYKKALELRESCGWWEEFQKYLDKASTYYMMKAKYEMSIKILEEYK